MINWENETVTLEVGSVYNLPSATVRDTEGNTYTATFSVKDSEGKAVEVVSNQFIVSDLRGYVVTVSVKVSDSVTKTRTITISVKDSSKPNITIKAPNQGVVGQVYQLPEVIVADNSGEAITPQIEVFLVNQDNSEVPQAVSGGSFTPTVAGTYKIKVTAQDSSGNKAESYKTFIIRTAPAPNEIEFFDDPGSIPNAVNLNDFDVIWLPSYQGETSSLPPWKAITR